MRLCRNEESRIPQDGSRRTFSGAFQPFRFTPYSQLATFELPGLQKCEASCTLVTFKNSVSGAFFGSFQHEMVVGIGDFGWMVEVVDGGPGSGAWYIKGP